MTVAQLDLNSFEKVVCIPVEVDRCQSNFVIVFAFGWVLEIDISIVTPRRSELL